MIFFDFLKLIRSLNIKNFSLLIIGGIVIISTYMFFKAREDINNKLLNCQKTINYQKKVIENLKNNLKTEEIQCQNNLKNLNLELNNKCDKDKLFIKLNTIDYKYNQLTPDIIYESNESNESNESKKILNIETLKDTTKLNSNLDNSNTIILHIK